MTQPSRRLVILGATGTVGVQALELLKTSLALEVVALSAHTRQSELIDLAAPSGGRTFLTDDPQQNQGLLEFLRQGEYHICLNAVVGA
ncbi:MAG: hypothetical protein HQ519_16730, partial [Planctomycetes bacterium]|nr:hypothetical protein [Planctomycetota bacterium]